MLSSCSQKKKKSVGVDGFVTKNILWPEPSIYVIKRPPTKSTATRMKAHHELEETPKNQQQHENKRKLPKCLAHKYCFNSHGTARFPQALVRTILPPPT